MCDIVMLRQYGGENGLVNQVDFLGLAHAFATM